MKSVLCARIQEKGALPFDEFMALSLYHPQFGYYSTKVEFGARGDFVTAPTLTPLFSEALAHFIAPKLDQRAIVELGPGNGQMAHDLLLALDQQKKLPGAYYLVEISPHLQALQQALIAKLPQHLQELVQWVNIAELREIKAVVLANEFFDALPVVRFKINEGILKECYIDVQNDQFIEVLHTARPELKDALNSFNLPEGYASEVCFAYNNWTRDLFKVLKAGLLLIIDYGYPGQEYYQPNRSAGTLQGYYQHQALDDYLAHPGQMDLTAHVDFSALSTALIKAGFTFEFFTYQNVFLLDQGILESQNKDGFTEQKLKRLLDPRLMGESFKVLAFSKNSTLTYEPSYELARFL